MNSTLKSLVQIEEATAEVKRCGLVPRSDDPQKNGTHSARCTMFWLMSGLSSTLSRYRLRVVEQLRQNWFFNLVQLGGVA